MGNLINGKQLKQNTLKENLLLVTGATATNGQILSYDASNGGFAWVNSIAEGLWSAGTGTDSAVLKGSGGVASGTLSVSEGISTTASGDYSHAEGKGNIASGVASHAEGGDVAGKGYITIASGECSHAEGQLTIAGGDISHAEGFGTNASGLRSHAEGNGTTASGNFSHSQGIGTEASGSASHSEGDSTIASGASSHAEGQLTIAGGSASHAEGKSTVASGDYSHAGGDGSTASGEGSFVHSNDSIASGENTVVLGGSNITGGTDNMVYVSQLNIDTLPPNSGNNHILIRELDGQITKNTLSGLAGVEGFVDGMSFDNSTYDLTLSLNDSTTIVTNLGLLANDVNVTGGTYEVSTGVVTFTNNSGNTFEVSGFTSGMTDSYTTSAALSGNAITFTNNIQGSNLYNVDLTPILDESPFKYGTSSTNAVLPKLGGNTIESGNNDSFIGGGSSNTIGDGTNPTTYSTIAGGTNNSIGGYSYANTIGGGNNNDITVAGGYGYSTIAGGYDNNITGLYSTIGGGRTNVISGNNSSIIGGTNNTSTHNNSHIIGSNITSVSANTAHVQKLNIKTLNGTTAVTPLALDANGMVVDGSTLSVDDTYSTGLTINNGIITVVGNAGFTSYTGGTVLETVSGNTAITATTIDGVATVGIDYDLLQLAVQSVDDKDKTPAVTSGNFASTTLTITNTPVNNGYVKVEINGVGYSLGDGVKTKDGYFSSDGGTTAKNIASISAGDVYYWNGTISGFDLDADDRVDFFYNILQ